MTSIDEEPEYVSALEDPEVAAAAAAAATATEAGPPPELADPLDGPVTLPGGYTRLVRGENGTSSKVVVNKAWIRELNGEAEERIAKAGASGVQGDWVTEILRGGVERLGDEENPTSDDFDLLLMGDKQYLLLMIARATYGDDLEFSNFGCPGCMEPLEFTVHLADDVPVARLDDPTDADFDVKLSRGRVAHVTLPTSEIEDSLSRVETSAEANTLLIAECVSTIEGARGTVTIAGDQDAARRLGIRDRADIIDKMSERMPGPRYNEVKFNHEPGCGTEVRVPVTLPHLFRGL